MTVIKSFRHHLQGKWLLDEKNPELIIGNMRTKKRFFAMETIGECSVKIRQKFGKVPTTGMSIHGGTGKLKTIKFFDFSLTAAGSDESRVFHMELYR